MSQASDHYFAEDFVSVGNSISPDVLREIVRLQRIQDGITNSILDMLRTPQYVIDELDWKLYLFQHPMSKPKWRN